MNCHCTLSRGFNFSGVGTHSGVVSNVFVEPTDLGSGITFVRVDKGNSSIIANVSNVKSTNASTEISNGTHSVKTIEHLMSALTAFGIFDANIYIDNEEMPIMDGSSKLFVDMISESGVIKSDNYDSLFIRKKVSVEYNGSVLSIEPSSMLEFDIQLNMRSVSEKTNICINKASYLKYVASARTFGFLSDESKLRSLGLIKGVSLNNSLILDDNGTPINDGGFRIDNELVMHKVLDAVGDFGLIGMPICGRITGTPSHTLNNLLVRKILSLSSCFDIQSTYNVIADKHFSINKVANSFC